MNTLDLPVEGSAFQTIPSARSQISKLPVDD
jgi:hypothetical protein